LYLVTTASLQADAVFFYSALGVFGVFALATRFTPLLAAMPDLRVTIECLAMVALISVVAWRAGVASGPVCNLYLLPVLTAALTLGRRETAALFVAATGCRLLLGDAQGLINGDMVYLTSLSIEMAPLLLLAITVSALVYNAQVARGQVRALTYQDELTGVFNMRAFSRLLNSEHRNVEAAGEGSYVVLKLDVNNMQGTNDQYGYETGNEVLVQVSRALQRSTRMSDPVARYGGDEFVVLLKGADAKIAKVIMNRIHQALYDSSISAGIRVIKPSVALGAAAYPDDGEDTRSIMQAADRAMNQNKVFQRNLVSGHAKAEVLRANAEATLS